MPAPVIVGALIAAVLGAGCASSGSPRRSPPSPPSPPASAPAYTEAASRPAVAGDDAISEAQALWLKVRSNAEKAAALEPSDPSRGFFDRALDTDGRALFTMLARPEFEPYAVTRGEIRARLLFVIKAPTPEDRREAIQAVDRGFAEIASPDYSRRRGGR
jgi:hypothetical protein